MSRSGSVAIILLVDDEPDDRQWMLEALNADGHTVFEAGDYETGLAVFREHKGKISLLVEDVSLPGRNGCELAKTLLGEDPTLRVLFISGHAGTEVVRFYGIDASDLCFLRKPFTPMQLTDRVRKLLESSEKAAGIGGQSEGNSL